MKLVKIKKLTNMVTCSFCKRKNTYHRIQGHPYGGQTCCKECFDSDDRILNAKIEDSHTSLGEERAYRLFGI